MSNNNGYNITAFATTDKPGKFKEITYHAPPLKDDEIYIKILACGLCHTDVIYMSQPETILGHEPVGEVVDVGSSVTKFAKGDIVGYSYLRNCCLDCRQCNSGNDIMCYDRVMFPEGNNNAFAHGVVCKDRFVYRIPDNLKPKEAAPLMCAGLTVFTALWKSQIPPTGRVAVIGIGGLGHLSLKFARAWGLHVTAISHTPGKKEECLKYGAHEFMCSKDFTADYIKNAPKFDMILDTVSADLDWDMYLNLLDRNGSFFLIGIPSGPIQIKEIFPFLQSEKIFRGSILGGRYIVELMLEFASRHNIKAAIEDYPMTPDGIAKAVEDCEANKLRYRAVLLPK
ncbi:hypothetical protein O0I10_000013 [Lichtheimia ornata]|uniref:Enoyl reductase (ER) domain-containing protein n=1 Tax=Lichtheimia ornata TaxID=688661 RepID=A0AAD7Y4R7_9FUNG|nr:uncharacterized protein O0I10_000013 [Lichtheimia ornata]KAJ8663740.1 hypothetical protein O0I10_000013 [Lichtheimia ornata]